MRYMNGRKMMSALLFAALCMTGCGKQTEEVPVETAPPIEVKSEVLGGTKTGYEEEVQAAETALKKGIVAYYANDMETFVSSSDVDVLFTMMYGEAPNQTELVKSLKERLPIPYDKDGNQLATDDSNFRYKLDRYEAQIPPNNRIVDEETGEIISLDWLSELKFDLPQDVTVTTKESNVISAEHAIWVLFQGKYYDEDTEWAYRKRKAVTPYNPEDVYTVDKAYEIQYTLGTHDKDTDTDIERDYVGYAIHINDEWKYEIAVEQTDKVFKQYLAESGLDEKGNVIEEPVDDENGTEESSDETADENADEENSADSEGENSES